MIWNHTDVVTRLLNGFKCTFSRAHLWAEIDHHAWRMPHQPIGMHFCLKRRRKVATSRCRLSCKQYAPAQSSSSRLALTRFPPMKRTAPATRFCVYVPVSLTQYPNNCLYLPTRDFDMWVTHDVFRAAADCLANGWGSHQTHGLVSSRAWYLRHDRFRRADARWCDSLTFKLVAPSFAMTRCDDEINRHLRHNNGQDMRRQHNHSKTNTNSCQSCGSNGLSSNWSQACFPTSHRACPPSNKARLVGTSLFPSRTREGSPHGSLSWASWRLTADCVMRCRRWTQLSLT